MKQSPLVRRLFALLPAALAFGAIVRAGHGSATARTPEGREPVVAAGVRVNQVGYLPGDSKVAIVESDGAAGRHDAGDTLKFVETTSYTALLLLYAADRYPAAFPGPPAHPSEPVQEARVGLEWLLKTAARPEGPCCQVGDEREHDLWSLP